MQLLAKALILSLAVVTASCGQSKEDAAVAHLLGHKAPGSVRLVNLTQKPVQLWIDGSSASNDVVSEQASIFIAKPAGKHDVKVMDGTSPLGANTVDLGNRVDQSVIFTEFGGKPNTYLVNGEPRHKDESQALVSVVLVSANSGDSADIQANGHQVAHGVGPLQPMPMEGLDGSTKFDIKVGNKQVEYSADVAKGAAYTLFVYGSGDNLAAVLLMNTGAAPKATGAAQG